MTDEDTLNPEVRRIVEQRDCSLGTQEAWAKWSNRLQNGFIDPEYVEECARAAGFSTSWDARVTDLMRSLSESGLVPSDFEGVVPDGE